MNFHALRHMRMMRDHGAGAGIRELPMRVKCAILPWYTLRAAFNAAGTASTEADDDPMHTPIGDA